VATSSVLAVEHDVQQDRSRRLVLGEDLPECVFQETPDDLAGEGFVVDDLDPSRA
jgi:hypothetical protein